MPLYDFGLQIGLIWDEYGIKQHENIALIPISPCQINFDNCNVLKEYLTSIDAKCFVIIL